MEIIGSIDNAALHHGDQRRPVYHLIFTSGMLVMVRVMNRSDERMKNPIRGADFGGGMQGSYSAAKNFQIWSLGEAQKRGEQVEKDLDNYVSSGPKGLKLLPYATISGATFSGGSLFKLPFLKLSTDEGEMEFRLIHNNYEKAGKLSKDIYNKYLGILEKVFRESLKIK